MARIWGLMLGLVLWFAACGPPPSVSLPEEKKTPPASRKSPATEPKSRPEPEKPRDTFKNLEYVLWREGRSRWALKAERAVHYRDRLEMEKPVVRSLEKPGLRLTAREGSYRFEEKLFCFRREVVLQTPDKGTLYTDLLYYRPAEKKLTGDRPLLLRDRGLVIRGVGFEYDLETGKLRIKGQSRVEFHG